MGVVTGGFDGNPKEYYFIKDGMLVSKVSEEDVQRREDGALARGFDSFKKKDGSIQYVKTAWGGIEGYLTKVEEKEVQFDTGTVQFLEITLEDAGVDYVISMNEFMANGSLTNDAADFIKVLPNLQFEQFMLVRPFKFNPEDNPEKTIRGITVSQDGSKVLKKFTREAPNGMPDAEKKTVAGKTKWDFSAQTEFLYGILQSEKLRLANFIDQQGPSLTDEGKDSEKKTDDLPF